MLGMTQERLADGLNLTFQQVQKYEKGANRVGASRLQQIASILNVPISYFFEEATVPTGDRQFRFELQSLFATQDGLDLAAAFQKIQDSKLRRTVVALVEQMSSD